MLEREQPTSKNSRDVPIYIFKNGVKVQDSANIQEAAKWLKHHTGDKFYRFGRIERGYVYGEPWSLNGATYNFTSDETQRMNRLKELERKK